MTTPTTTNSRQIAPRRAARAGALTLALALLLGFAPRANARHVVALSAPVRSAIIGAYGHDPVSWGLRPNGQPTWPNAEVPPWALGHGRYLLSTAWTYQCDAGLALFRPIRCNDRRHTFLVSSPEMNSYSSAAIPRTIGGIAQDYRRNFYAIFSEQTIAGHTLAVEHGETKNESNAGQLYQGTVDVAPASSCAFNTGGLEPPGNCLQGSTCAPIPTTPSPWCSYAAFVDATFGGHALGPIVWPHDGYTMTDGRAASNGNRHPFTVRARNGNVYVYYLDCSPSAFGIRVARTADGRSWKTWDRASHRWLPSLPSGVTLSSYQNYYRVKGPQTAPLFPHEPPGYQATAFQAARDTTGGYIGIETGAVAGQSRLFVRTSHDLLTWSSPMTIPGNAGGYALLLNAAADSNGLIDERDFYVETTNGGELDVQHLMIAADGVGIRR